MTAAIALVLVGQAAALPTISSAYQNAIRTYASCIEASMVELEPSKASIDEIFEAAQMECAGVRVTSIFAIMKDLEGRPTSVSGKSSQEAAIEILDGVAAMSKKRSLVVILRKRAGLPPIDVSRL